MDNDNRTFIGIDISKRNFDVALEELKKVSKFENSCEGINRFLDWLKSIPKPLVCLEATGGYEMRLVDSLHAQGIPVSVVNPRQIRDFAKAKNQLAKTDQIDARIIASFAKLIRPRITKKISVNQRKLRDLTARRAQVTKMIRQEKNRLEHATNHDIIEMIRQVVDLYEMQLKEIQLAQETLIRNDEKAQRKSTIIHSVPGLGPATAAALIANLPELGQLNRAQIARLIGVAPTNRDSGQLRGKRTIGGGRVEIRNALFMPTIVAKKYNPVIKSFYQRLIQNGKPKMVAIMAAMRKLITILNQMIKNNQTWQNSN